MFLFESYIYINIILIKNSPNNSGSIYIWTVFYRNGIYVYRHICLYISSSPKKINYITKLLIGNRSCRSPAQYCAESLVQLCAESKNSRIDYRVYSYSYSGCVYVASTCRRTNTTRPVIVRTVSKSRFSARIAL